MDALSSGAYDNITDVPGIRVGHASDIEAKTGVTVVLSHDRGVTAAVHVGGNASSTRQMDSLKPSHIVDRAHGICFCGGSAFGLDAAGGVQAALEEQGIGVPVVGATIPIVPAAAIFDLNFGDGSVRPNFAMGREAFLDATSGPVELGSVGAGAGASVGKLFGIEQGMKGGVGSASLVAGDLIVGALVVVNAYGDVTDSRGKLLAGCRTGPSSLELADAARLLQEGKARSRKISVESTTLAVVAANAFMDKVTAARIAAQASLGLGHVIRPFHSHIDGDLTIVLGAGELDEDQNRLGLLGAVVLQRAVEKAVRSADGFGIIPAWQDLDRSGL